MCERAARARGLASEAWIFGRGRYGAAGTLGETWKAATAKAGILRNGRRGSRVCGRRGIHDGSRVRRRDCRVDHRVVGESDAPLQRERKEERERERSGET